MAARAARVDRAGPQEIARRALACWCPPTVDCHADGLLEVIG
nr:DUF4326 domain-containing protein [Actinoplanes toevensis]